jgi:hypothetical protein
MERIPTRQEMIDAVKNSGCENIRRLDLIHMDRFEIYNKLVAAKCPCLERLMRRYTKPRPQDSKGSGSSCLH